MVDAVQFGLSAGHPCVHTNPHQLWIWLLAGTAVPRDGVSLTATGLALALTTFSIYCLRSVLHGIHAWLVSCTGETYAFDPACFDKPSAMCKASKLCPASMSLAVVTGISGWVFKSLFGWMDIPDSLCEVVLSFCLLVAVHTALRELAVFAADMLDVPEQPKPAANKVADSDGPDGTR